MRCLDSYHFVDALLDQPVFIVKLRTVSELCRMLDRSSFKSRNSLEVISRFPLLLLNPLELLSSWRDTLFCTKGKKDLFKIIDGIADRSIKMRLLEAARNNPESLIYRVAHHGTQFAVGIFALESKEMLAKIKNAHVLLAASLPAAQAPAPAPQERDSMGRKPACGGAGGPS